MALCCLIKYFYCSVKSSDSPLILLKNLASSKKKNYLLTINTKYYWYLKNFTSVELLTDRYSVILKDKYIEFSSPEIFKYNKTWWILRKIYILRTKLIMTDIWEKKTKLWFQFFKYCFARAELYSKKKIIDKISINMGISGNSSILVPNWYI